MSRGIDRELIILREIASQRRVPRALKRAMRDRPWIVEASGVPLPVQPAVPTFLLAGATAVVVAMPTLSYAQQFVSYTVRPGDTLSTIAARHLGGSWRWKELHAANPGIRNAALIFPGQVIKLVKPGTSHEAPAAPSAIKPTWKQELPIQTSKRLVPATVLKAAPAALPKPVEPSAPLSPAPREPFWPLFLRFLDILCMPMALFGARQLWLRREKAKKAKRVRKVRPMPPIIPLPRPAASTLSFWDHHPGNRESYNFLAGR